MSDGVPVRDGLILVVARAFISLFVTLFVAQAMRVHSIDYGAFLRAQAAPVAAAAFHRVEEQQEQLVAALSSADVGGSGQPISMAEEVAAVKIDAGQQRPKIDGAAAERKPKIGGAAASKGGSQKRNK